MCSFYTAKQNTPSPHMQNKASVENHNQSTLTILEGKVRLLFLNFHGYMLLYPKCGTSIFVLMCVVLKAK